MGSGKKIGISEKTKRSACLVLKEAQDSHESAGKDPMGLAEAANVTEVTIRNRYKSLKTDHNISV